MKRIYIILAMMLCAAGLSAQQPAESVSNPIKQWTSSFSAIDVDAPIKLKLVAIPIDQAPYIVYDTKGNDTSKFSAEVEKGRVLKIRERYDPKRMSITEVEVYFNSLSDIDISKAEATVEGVLKSKIIDIIVSNGATLQATLDVMDLCISISGNSCVELNGEALYHTADVATAQYNAAGLESMSTIVEAHHNSEVRVDAQQRLEAKSTTGGKIYYTSNPEIIRTEKTLFGVDVTPLK
jgi:hypothetical protein